MAASRLFIAAFHATLITYCLSRPEQGVWTVEMDQDNTYLAIPKSMYNNSKISIKIECLDESGKDVKISVQWKLRTSPCAEEYIGVEVPENALGYFLMPQLNRGYGYESVDLVKSELESGTCGSDGILKDLTGTGPTLLKVHPLNNTSETTKTENKATVSPTKTTTPAKRVKRAIVPVPTTTTKNATQNLKSSKASSLTAGHNEKIDHSVVMTTWKDAIYLFILNIHPSRTATADTTYKYKAKVTVWMRGSYGYLSAIDWPLLLFYGVMCVIYVVFGIVWLVLSACNWRDLLRIQFWIGAVIILGMLEKAVFYAEYQTINYTGKSVRGAVILAELVSCMKRSLARMLVIIVSLGFGIVKPRLGPMLHKVVLVGIVFFILGSIEGCLRVLRPKSDPSNHALLASIPLAVLDSGICWWIFTSLVQTIRTLRLRRNIVKLSMYRHFTNTLIFAILASIAFMIWSIKMHKLATCVRDWKEIWIDEAYWHFLFSIILCVIMVLWRPTNNNQRYAFSPLLDAADDDDEDDETVMNDAFEGMKMRPNKNGSPKQKDNKSRTEDDLKWIEDNIPSSVTDAALPGLLDSDEEIMTTKFEMSKME